MVKNRIPEGLRYYEYFESIASKRVSDRKKHSYYWNDITQYIDYFSHPELKVLEVGCGTGELLNEIRAEMKTGIDFSPSMIEIAKKRFPNLDFHVMPAEAISLDGKY